MATTGVFNGTNLLLKVEGDTIGHTTSCSLTISHDLPDATTKDSNGFSEVISDLEAARFLLRGLVDYSDAASAIELI